MRLKKIKLAGFKSFVDPTTIPLPSNMVGIVGPNGCGKSNTIDAVRWVMGESSAKNLRGDSMSDVIFNGSTARKPVGQASVELVFDNTEGRLGGEYAQYNEISIKRQVTRDGQSNYYLNSTKCRRRDITDIFLGTGLGPRSYAIIEQGTISRLIEAKPEDLRVFIEEAAGISRYKERRRETENRIKHTRENLERIDDLREELEKRLATLQRQAKTAEKYKAYKEDERKLKAELLALKFANLEATVKERDKQIQAQETALEGQVAEQRGLEAAIESQREHQVESNERFNEVQGRYYAIGSEIARLEQTIQHVRDTRQQQEREMGEVEEAWREATEHLSNDRDAIDELKMSLESLEEESLVAREKESESALVRDGAEEEMQTWQQQWDEFNQTSSEHIRSAEVEKTRIQHQEQSLAQVNQRMQRMEDELGLLSPGSLEGEIAELSQAREQSEEQLGQLHHESEQQAEQIRYEREHTQALSGELDAERGRLQSMQGRRASLEALQQQALGKDDHTLNDWLKRKGLDDAARLAQNIDVESGWEKAVETALGLHLESVCVEGMEAVADALSDLDKGALSLFDTGMDAGQVETGGAGTPLLDKVRCAYSMASLLSGVYAAETLEQALALRSQIKASESIVTRDGVWLGRDWLRVSRGVDEKAGVLQREQELKSLQSEIEETAERVDELQAKLQQSRTRQQALERAQEELQGTLRQVTQSKSGIESQLSARQERMQQFHSRKQRLEGDIVDLRQQRQDMEASLAEARARLDEILAKTENFEQTRHELQQRRDALRQRLEQSRQQARADRDRAHELALKLQSLRAQLEGTQQRLERMQGQLSHLERRREELQAQLRSEGDPVADMTQELEEKLAKRLGVEEELQQARRAMEEIDHTMRELADERNQAEQRSQEIRSQLEKLRMASQEYRVRCQTVQEQFAETGFVMDEVRQGLPDAAQEAQWQEQVNEIGQRIQRLGAINLAAIEEFEEQSERKNYLDKQNADLIDALTTLENAIRKIDKETRTRFKDTFDKVNDGVKELFPRLFGGGHAYLELTGEDLLDTGVAVMARPPGKRNSSIHLLSGGEKALTAVALVFSIFQLNPAPFCMLDEVDAPLDEANVGRFCTMVKEMSEKVQFIFITHNKTTMEMSDHLAGVTMHEPGVSRMVAVDVDEAVRMVG
ncbi:chromosome segregation protein SMC [Candidatus Tenderia electrophaga]|uniref:Chromosome partition protein Smc n=1 Tax=Candidatus Tenderia electrophaga TaxID=1748243 RepID=A0A0S2TEG6_9GAMM|nr:chromosome segregation protein SMC [Candidatus Tenderia electrophaga]